MIKKEKELFEEKMKIVRWLWQHHYNFSNESITHFANRFDLSFLKIIKDRYSTYMGIKYER